jgi:hypothetical protein
MYAVEVKALTEPGSRFALAKKASKVLAVIRAGAAANFGESLWYKGFFYEAEPPRCPWISNGRAVSCIVGYGGGTTCRAATTVTDL